jgi:predicted DNA-binding transcriptional regulator YafY
MKASRLLSMLLILQGTERRSARALAAELEVSERTVYRDVDALSAAGVPVYAERGAQGGIALAAGYRRALTQFGDDEIRALFISGSNPLVDLGLGVERERALEKLSGALSDVQRKAVAKSRGRIHLDQRRWNQADQPLEHLAVLRRAVWDDRQVTLQYRDRQAKITERTIDPLGLVAKAGVWYLVARSGAEYRTFRAERILGVTASATTFERPRDFDLDTYWRNWIANLEEGARRVPVVVSVHADALDAVMRYWEARVLNEPSGDAVSVRVVFPSEDVALHQLIAWGTRARLMEPLALRDELLARARSIVEHYAAAAG